MAPSTTTGIVDPAVTTGAGRDACLDEAAAAFLAARMRRDVKVPAPLDRGTGT